MRGLRLIIVSIVVPVLLPVSLVVGQAADALSLRDCLQLAQQRNTSIQQFDNLEIIRKQRLKMVQTALIPQLSASAGMNELIQNSTVVFTDNLLPTSEINGARTSGTQASINASLGLMNFGQTIMNVRSTKHLLESERLKDLEQRNAIILLISQAYYACVVNNEMYEAVEEQKQASENVMGIAQKKMSLGETDSTDYYQAIINYNEDLNALESIKIVQKQSRDELKILIGLDVSGDINLKPNILLVVTKGENIDEPDLGVQALKSDRDRSEAQKKAALWSIIPEVSLFGGYGYSNQSFQNGVVQRNTAIGPSYGLSLSYDLGGAKNAVHQRKISHVQADNLRMQIEEESNRVKSEREVLSKSIEQHRKKMESCQIMLSLSERTLKNVLLKYKLGAVTLTELRTAQAQHLRSKIEYKSVIVDYNLSQLNLLSKMNKLMDWESTLP